MYIYNGNTIQLKLKCYSFLYLQDLSNSTFNLVLSFKLASHVLVLSCLDQDKTENNQGKIANTMHDFVLLLSVNLCPPLNKLQVPTKYRLGKPFKIWKWRINYYLNPATCLQSIHDNVYSGSFWFCLLLNIYHLGKIFLRAFVTEEAVCIQIIQKANPCQNINRIPRYTSWLKIRAWCDFVAVIDLGQRKRSSAEGTWLPA